MDSPHQEFTYRTEDHQFRKGKSPWQPATPSDLTEPSSRVDTLFVFDAPDGDSITHVEIFGRRADGEGFWYSGIDNLTFQTESDI